MRATRRDRLMNYGRPWIDGNRRAQWNNTLSSDRFEEHSNSSGHATNREPRQFLSGSIVWHVVTTWCDNHRTKNESIISQRRLLQASKHKYTLVLSLCTAAFKQEPSNWYHDARELFGESMFGDSNLNGISPFSEVPCFSASNTQIHGSLI